MLAACIRSVTSHYVKITDFCNKPIQVVKEMAGDDLTKNGAATKITSWWQLIDPLGSLWWLTVADDWMRGLLLSAQSAGFGNVYDRSGTGNGCFCNLPTTENDAINEEILNFEVEMQQTDGSNCEKYIRTERKDRALGGYKVKKEQ